VSTVFISLGSNQGDRRRVLRAALHSVRRLGSVVAVSPLYRTTPVGVERVPHFLNAVAQLETALGPMTLLRGLQAIERKFGRQCGAARWSERSLDLDILLYDNAIIETPFLTIPHPRIAQRLFVLVPIAEIAPNLVLPLSHRTVKEHLNSMADPSQSIVRLPRIHLTVHSAHRQ